jgi:hydrogenase nickel incorporation protein HypA/HybF
MHELSVTQNIIEIVNRHAEQAGASRVSRIHLVVGELSSIVDDSVQFYFDYLSEDTLCAGAELVFRRVDVKLLCGNCGETWQPEGIDWRCPACGESQARVTEGREFYVDSIEVEDP